MSNQRIISVLENYTGEQASLDAFVSVATEELGADWTGKIYDEMADISDDIKERLDHAFNYYAATTAWNELQSYLTQETPLDYTRTLERIPVLEHWLSFFGAAGDDAVSQLKNKLRQEGEQTNQNTSLLTNPFASMQSPVQNTPIKDPNIELDEQTQQQVQDIFNQASETPDISNNVLNDLNSVSVSDEKQEGLSEDIKDIFDDVSTVQSDIRDEKSVISQNDEALKTQDYHEPIDLSVSPDTNGILSPSFDNNMETVHEVSEVNAPMLSDETKSVSDVMPIIETSHQSLETPVAFPTEEITQQSVVSDNQTEENNSVHSPVFDVVQENYRTDVFDPIASQGAALENNTQVPQDENAWLIGKIFRQIDFISNIEGWISFRCLELGYTDFYTYRYYGFLVDVLDKTIEELKEILNRVELYDLIEMRYPNGVQYLQNKLLAYEKESQEAHDSVLSDLSPLPNENLSADDLRRRLGGMDTSMEKEYLGPAPDGFEMIDDPYETLDETAVQKEYEKIEAEGNLMPATSTETRSQQTVSSAPMAENPIGTVKSTSQTPQNGVQRKMTFSFKAKPAIKPDGTGGATS